MYTDLKVGILLEHTAIELYSVVARGDMALS